MKSTTFIAVLLTLITLLLVTGAGAFFLWQGREDMLRDAQIQASEIEGHVRTINELQTTAAAREMVLATSEALVVTGEAELAQSQALLATRDEQLAQIQATAESVTPTPQPEPQPQPGNGPPPLEILNPQFGASVASDVILPIIVIGSASEGVERIELTVGDRPPLEEEYEDGTTFFVFRRTIFNLQPGSLTITATVTTFDNEMESTSVRIFVRDAEEEQESGGTESRLLQPVASRP